MAAWPALTLEGIDAPCMSSNTFTQDRVSILHRLQCMLARCIRSMHSRRNTSVHEKALEYSAPPLSSHWLHHSPQHSSSGRGCPAGAVGYTAHNAPPLSHPHPAAARLADQHSSALTSPPPVPHLRARRPVAVCALMHGPSHTTPRAPATPRRRGAIGPSPSAPITHSTAQPGVTGHLHPPQADPAAPHPPAHHHSHTAAAHPPPRQGRRRVSATAPVPTSRST